MALIWFDGFESYQNDDNDADIGATHTENLYIQSEGGYWDLYGLGYGRNGKGIRVFASSNTMIYNFNSATTIIFGAAYRPMALGEYYGSYPFLAFMDNTTVQIRLHELNGKILVYNGSGTKLGETSEIVFQVGVWRYIEIKITIDNSVGSVEIRSNEKTVLNLTNVDTQNTANSQINRIGLRAFYSTKTYHMDDLYICDTTGTKNNDFLGDVRIDVVRPNGAGTYSQFTPSAGSNYENVDEEYPDDDTTYNQASNVGDKDTYAMSDLSAIAGGTIHAVKSQVTVRKTDASARGAKVLTKSGATENLSSEFSLSDTYTTIVDIMENNPDDSAAWEEADVNAMEVGVEVSS